MKSELANQTHNDFYRSLRRRIDHWFEKKKVGGRYAKFLLLAPDLFHLLCKLSADSQIPLREKAKLGVGIVYFITPMDVIPDIITGPLGYMDDIALAAYVLNSIINRVDPEIVRKHWAGDENILQIVKQILDGADKFLGKGVWKKVKRNLR